MGDQDQQQSNYSLRSLERGEQVLPRILVGQVVLNQVYNIIYIIIYIHLYYLYWHYTHYHVIAFIYWDRNQMLKQNSATVSIGKPHSFTCQLVDFYGSVDKITGLKLLFY